MIPADQALAEALDPNLSTQVVGDSSEDLIYPEAGVRFWRNVIDSAMCGKATKSVRMKTSSVVRSEKEPPDRQLGLHPHAWIEGDKPSASN